MVHLPYVRLWQQDAAAAVASGAPGLMALSPLMQGANAALVETAAQELFHRTAPPLQAELLAALGIFSRAVHRHRALATHDHEGATDDQ